MIKVNFSYNLAGVQGVRLTIFICGPNLGQKCYFTILKWSFAGQMLPAGRTLPPPDLEISHWNFVFGKLSCYFTIPVWCLFGGALPFVFPDQNSFQFIVASFWKISQEWELSFCNHFSKLRFRELKKLCQGIIKYIEIYSKMTSNCYKAIIWPLT